MCRPSARKTPVSRLARARSSEVRLVGMGKRRYVVTEVKLVVRLANVLDQRAFLDAPPMLDRRPRHVESAWIVNSDEYLQCLAAIGHLEALDNVHLFGMWGAIIVDERAVIQSDRVDNQLVAFVMAHGFAVPRRRHVLRMRYVQIDMAYLGVKLVDVHDHF